MKRLARLAIHHPRRTLAVWSVLAVALVVNGLSLHLDPTNFDVKGTPSADVGDRADRAFGQTSAVPVLLEGPAKAVQAQGRRLVRRLDAQSGTRVLSPFGRRAPGALIPRPGAALLIAQRPTKLTFSGQPAKDVQRVVDATLRRPVASSITGYSAIGRDIPPESVDATHNAEKLTVPVLLIVLLIVFRSPIAAGLTLLIGGVAVQSSFGVIDLLARSFEVTDIAGPLASLMALALGIDYCLLVVSRFREYLAEGRDTHQAVEAALDTAGRTVLFACASLLVTMTTAMLISPGSNLRSAAIGTSVAGIVSALSALTALPAALVLIGPNIDRWRFGGAVAPESGTWGKLARGVIRRPLLAALPAVVLLAALAPSAIGLKTGPPDVRVLPPDSPSRQATEHFAAVMGPGWSAPFDVYAFGARDTKPRALARLRRTVVATPGIAHVLGPDVRGRAVHFAVIPRTGPNDPRTGILDTRLRHRTDAFARIVDANAAEVGGVSARLIDYRQEFGDRLPLLLGVMTLISALALIPLLRSLVLPVIGIVLNSVTLLASMGVLALLCTGDDPLLGGPGYIDLLAISGMLAIVYGLSLDYQLFILTRVREEWLRTGRIDLAIIFSIERTGRVITGAAAIMTGVFAVSTLSELQTLRQVATGLVVAIVIDATLVRLVLLPVAMLLCGRWTFWLPGWLDRALPEFDVDGEAPPTPLAVPVPAGA